MMRSFITLLFAEYYWGHQLKEDEIDAVCGMWEMRNIFRILFGKSEGKRHRRRRTRRWENNIKLVPDD
jgi:hypothetical protein